MPSTIGPPSTSPEVQGWISNFADEDQATARLLVDSLRIVSEGNMRASLLRRLGELIDRLSGPVLLVPVRDIADIDKRWRRNRPAVYADFPPYVDFGPKPGSEAIVANILREITGIRGTHPSVLSPDTPLETLRARRCRNIIFVSDYAGSGSQSLNYLKSWLRNPTIRSWRSFGWLRIHLLLFSASRFAIRRLRASAALDELDVIEVSADFASAPWTEDQAHDVRRLCIRYTEPKRLRRGEEFGFARSAGLFVMTHSVPNNLPAVFLQERGPRAEPWTPLFPSRTFPAILHNQLAGYRPRQEFDLDTGAIPDKRLAVAFESGLPGTQRPFLMLLAAIAGRSHDVEVIAETLATSTISVDDMTRLLRSWGLIDRHYHLTDNGWLALQRARMQPRKVTFALKENSQPYYPMQLRGVGDV
jgi:hypothetical protein